MDGTGDFQLIVVIHDRNSLAPDNQTAEFASGLKPAGDFHQFSAFSRTQETANGLNLFKRDVMKVRPCGSKSRSQNSSDESEGCRLQPFGRNYEVGPVSCSVFFQPLIG